MDSFRKNLHQVQFPFCPVLFSYGFLSAFHAHFSVCGSPTQRLLRAFKLTEDGGGATTPAKIILYSIRKMYMINGHDHHDRRDREVHGDLCHHFLYR